MRDDESTRDQATGKQTNARDRTNAPEGTNAPDRTDVVHPPPPDTVTRIGPAGYAPGAVNEVTLPPSDERREAHLRDLDDPADAPVDPDVLRDGGPPRRRGVATTTGGRRAGPASTRRRPRQPGGKVAPTTTGDATSGKFSTPDRGSTSDAVSQANQVGNFGEH